MFVSQVFRLTVWFFLVIGCLSSINKQSILMKNNTIDEDITGEEEIQELLSAKMTKLSIRQIKTNCLTSLEVIQDCNSEKNTHKKSNSVTSTTSLQNSIQKYDKENRALNQSTKNRNGIAKKSNMNKSEKKKTEEVKVVGVKLFEVHEMSDRRRGHITQVRGMKVSEFSGKGLLLLPNSKKFEGEWIDGTLAGDVKISYPNGDVYFGQVYNYQKHGKGYLYYASGQKYVGDFSCGDLHGEGILYSKNGQVIFDGEWRRGKQHDI